MHREAHIPLVYPVEMGQMSDYDIRPKPKVWAGSLNECRTLNLALSVYLSSSMTIITKITLGSRSCHTRQEKLRDINNSQTGSQLAFDHPATCSHTSVSRSSTG